MVKTITVIPASNNSNDEIIQQDEEIINVQEKQLKKPVLNLKMI